MDKMAEYIHYNNLFDIYSPLLTQREQEIFHLFFEENFSLQEIAFERKVSKSSIGKAIQTITKKLDSYEDKLHFFEKEQKYLMQIQKLKGKM